MTRFRIALASLVTVIWAVGYILAYARGGETPQELSALIALVLGWAFAGELREVVRRRVATETQPPGGDDAP